MTDALPATRALCRTLVLLVTAGLCTHCGSEADPGLPSVNETGCERILRPFDPRQETASPDPNTAPAQTYEHVHERINLVDFDGGKGGYVIFDAPYEAEYTIFFDTITPFRLLNAQLMPVPFEYTGQSPLCPDAIPQQAVYDLAQGRYFLKLGGFGYINDFIGITIEDTGAAHMH